MAPLAICVTAAALALVCVLIYFAVLLFLERRDCIYLGLRRLPRRAFLPAIGQEQKLILRAARISYREIDVSDRSGIVVRGLRLRRALDALSLCAVSTVAARQFGRGVREVVSYPRLLAEHQTIAGAYSVEELSGEVTSVKMTQLLSDLVVPFAQRNCIMQYCNRSAIAPVDDGLLHILVSSVVAPLGSEPLPPTLFDLEHGVDQGSVFRPSGQGVPITDDARGITLAEVVGNSLYVLFDLFDFPYDAQLGIAARLLQKAAPELNTAQMLRRVVDALATSSGDAAAREEKFGVSVSAEFASRQKDVFKFMTESLFSPALKRPIVIARRGQKVTANSFLMLVDSPAAPIRTVGGEQNARPFGRYIHDLPVPDLPTGKNIPIFDDSGLIVAEISSQGMTVLLNVARWGSHREAEVLGLLLLEAKKLLPFLAIQDAHLAPPRQGQTPVIDRMAESLIMSRLEQACLTQVTTLPASNHRTGKSIGQMLKIFREQELELLRLEAHPDESLGEEFDQLFQLASVRDVKVQDEKLIVSTTKLFCIDPRSGRRHEIGAFDIHLPTNSSNGAPTYFNRTRQVCTPVGMMQAPHVRSDGWACLGNVGDLFPQLLANRQFSSAVQVAIAYIESVNVDDGWGQYIDCWPLVG